MPHGPIAARLLFALAVALTLGACRDHFPTAPPLARFTPHLSIDGGDPAPHSVAVTLPIVDGAPASAPLNAYAEPTLVEVRLDGAWTVINTESGSLRAAGGAAGFFIDGFWQYCALRLAVSYQDRGHFQPVCGVGPLVDTLIVQGAGTVLRSQGVPYTSYYTYSGQESATITPIATTLQLAAESADGLAGRTVTYTASTADASAFTVKEWTFVPDDPTTVQLERVGQRATGVHLSVVSGAATSDSGGLGPCAAPETTCQETVTQSGTMYVLASVLGVDQQAKVHVVARPDSLMLTAVPSTVKPGEQVTFTAQSTNGSVVNVQGWSWQSNPPAHGAPLTANGSACGTSTMCALSIYEAGTMTVTAVIEGVVGIQVATAAIQVMPCPPSGDPRIDDPQFRKQMVDLLTTSQRGNTWYEHGGELYVRPSDGTHLILEIPSLNPSPCSYKPDYTQRPPIPDGYVRDTADVHTHPYAPGVPFTGCSQPGIKPSDTVKGQRGPSNNGDWPEAVTVGRTGYLIEGNGNIWRWNYPLGPYWSSANTEWRRDGKSICYNLVQ